MPTPIFNPQAAVWSSYIDTHAELIPAFEKRDSATRCAYQIGQVGFVVLIASSHVIANAGVGINGALHELPPMSLPSLGIAGWMVIKGLATFHEAWRNSSWGFSASSLQKIYKANPDAYDKCGNLRCINCQRTLWPDSQADHRYHEKVRAVGAKCDKCGFKLWPSCSRLSATLQNLRGSI